MVAIGLLAPDVLVLKQEQLHKSEPLFVGQMVVTDTLESSLTSPQTHAFRFKRQTTLGNSTLATFVAGLIPIQQDKVQLVIFIQNNSL